MISKSQRKKYKPGVVCLVDVGMSYEWEVQVSKAPMVSYGEVWVIVKYDSEVWDEDMNYMDRMYEIRIPLERVTLK